MGSPQHYLSCKITDLDTGEQLTSSTHTINNIDDELHNNVIILDKSHRHKKRRKWFPFVFVLHLFFCANLANGEPNHELKYVWGDALTDPDALGPNAEPYPWDTATQIAGKSRIPRSLFSDGDESPTLLTPEETRSALLSAFEPPAGEDGSFLVRNLPQKYHRKGRSETTTTTTPAPTETQNGGCVPTRLCETSYNTTAPMYGISLTSGNPVTIVQKFPDLLQQVVYQVCKSEECHVIHGECIQTYLPYLFLVIPLGPVTLTGQDYVLVESGCTCRPKYAKREDNQPPLPFISPFNNTANKNAANNKPRINKRF